MRLIETENSTYTEREYEVQIEPEDIEKRVEEILSNDEMMEEIPSNIHVVVVNDGQGNMWFYMEDRN